VACMREMRDTYRISVERPEGSRQLVGPRHSWSDNIKMNLQEFGRAMDWISLAQNRDS
jgi:hypothetical protein